MTTAADDPAVEEAFEAYLAGRAVPAEQAALAAFAGAVRATAIQPGRPNAALAELLATGLLVDQPPLSARTAKRRRRRMWFISVIFAKIASAGAIAQAATGAGIVLVGFTGVGAAGALPTPVQHGFATVVAAISPMTPSDGSDTTSDPVAAHTPATTTTPAATATSEAAEPTETSGATDGAVATNPAEATTSAPKNHGQQVSSEAHDRNAARKAAHKTGSDDSENSDATATSSPEPTDAGSSDAGSSDETSSHKTSSDESSGHGRNSGNSGHGD